MRLLVCPASSLARLLAGEQASHLLSIASPERPAPRVPDALAHLHLAFHDILGPVGNLRPASRGDVAALLAFGRAWDGTRPLAIACEFGVSRSPAAAFALACQARPDVAPAAIAGALRAASPQATPNPRIVALADGALRRRGAMVEAILAIGRGADYAGPAPFGIDLAALVPAPAA